MRLFPDHSRFVVRYSRTRLEFKEVTPCTDTRQLSIGRFRVTHRTDKSFNGDLLVAFHLADDYFAHASVCSALHQCLAVREILDPP